MKCTRQSTKTLNNDLNEYMRTKTIIKPISKIKSSSYRKVVTEVRQKNSKLDSKSVINPIPAFNYYPSDKVMTQLIKTATKMFEQSSK